MEVRTGVLAVVLVLAAGCSALPAGEAPAEPTRTLTPAPVQGDPQTPTPPASVSLPPGVRWNETVDSEALARAHNASLAGVSYTYVFERTRESVPDGERVIYSRTHAAVNDTAALVATEGFPFTPNRTVYLTEEGGYQRDDQTNATTNVSRTLASTETTGVNVIRPALHNQRVQVSVVQRDGRQYLRLYKRPGAPPSEVFDRSDQVLGYTVTAYVTEDGLVRTLDVAFTIRDKRVSIRAEFRNVSETSVPRPAWAAGTPDSAGRSGGNGTARSAD